jgi:hypothetical protein
MVKEAGEKIERIFKRIDVDKKEEENEEEEEKEKKREDEKYKEVVKESETKFIREVTAPLLV